MFFKYLSYVIRHKWHVMIACFKRGLIWRGLVHDMSKFMPSEFGPYMRYFYGKKSSDITRGRDETGYYKPYDTGDLKFDWAWLLHQKRNDHHWQYFILPLDDGGFKAMPMTEDALQEMVCDWVGAGLAQGKPDIIGWYKKNCDKMILHPETRKLVERELDLIEEAIA